MPINYFLYISRLAPDMDSTCVGAIVKQARILNANAGVTGVLGFDGERFVQYAEGPPDAIGALITALASDKRHVDFDLRSQGHGIAERKFSDWQMGYADFEEFPFDISCLEALHDQAAIQFFLDNSRSMDFA
ncbi:BLUF domain-containing protein [Ottowia thiooxydans]|uniref:BLUF domain-containing protein n=1 Tax=Ottowia thiooxydans TaxID=219182 RepID=A0ABV2Q701_9BURK